MQMESVARHNQLKLTDTWLKLCFQWGGDAFGFGGVSTLDIAGCLGDVCKVTCVLHHRHTQLVGILEKFRGASLKVKQETGKKLISRS